MCTFGVSFFLILGCICFVSPLFVCFFSVLVECLLFSFHVCVHLSKTCCVRCFFVVCIMFMLLYVMFALRWLCLLASCVCVS